MSLQVWLPFNGNLNNNGLSILPASTVNTMSEISSGKTGKCMKGNLLYHYTSDPLPSEYSFATWYKYDASWPTGNVIVYCKNTSEASNCQCYFSIYSSGTKLRYMGVTDVTYNYTFSTGVWYHLAITCKNNVISMFINGVMVKSTSVSATPTSLNLGIGCRGSNASGTSYVSGGNGNFNDTRIYDHALSAKEVEIISRGLIVHYPLNGGDSGQTNLCKTTPKSSTPTSYEAFKINLTENLTKGNKYTVQLWDVDVSHTGKSEADLGVFLYWGGGNVSLTNWKGSPFTNGHADYLVSTFTAPNSTHSTVSNAWINVYNSVPSASGTMSMSIGRWKLESGEVATSYLPATTDTEYTTYGYNVTTEYDTSGNMYDGVRNGTLVQTADTPRYQTCTTFNGTDSFIESDSLPLSTQTISVWLKTTWSSSSGYRMAMHDKNTGLAIGWSGVQLITYVGTSNGGTGSRIDTTNIWTANTWHHVVVVKTGDNTRTVYIDGVECAASGTNYWGGDLVKLNIGARHINGSYAAYFNGLISDFRAYATQLTQAQVLDLYRSCGSVSDTGRLLTYELVES